MIQLNFLNARVKDTGYGLEVNGKPLDEIISVAVGTLKELPDRYGSKQRTGESFSSDLCNVSVTIDDRSKEITETITISEDGEFAEFLNAECKGNPVIAISYKEV